MRGPLGSLIAQLSNNCCQKALPPSLFAKPWRTSFLASYLPVAKVPDKSPFPLQPNGSKYLS